MRCDVDLGLGVPGLSMAVDVAMDVAEGFNSTPWTISG
jgi:hypothetical protein